jgi:hypothetical protein
MRGFRWNQSMKKQTHPSRLAKALLETAKDLRRIGAINEAAHENIMQRLVGRTNRRLAAPRAPTYRYRGKGRTAP